MKEYIKVVFGSRGEIENVELNKFDSFDELVVCCKEIYNENVEGMLRDCGDDEEDKEMMKGYVDEFCELSDDKEKNIVCVMLNEEEGIGWYGVEYFEKLGKIDLSNSEVGGDWDRVVELIYDDGIGM